MDGRLLVVTLEARLTNAKSNRWLHAVLPSGRQGRGRARRCPGRVLPVHRLQGRFDAHLVGVRGIGFDACVPRRDVSAGAASARTTRSVLSPRCRVSEGNRRPAPTASPHRCRVGNLRRQAVVDSDEVVSGVQHGASSECETAAVTAGVEVIIALGTGGKSSSMHDRICWAVHVLDPWSSHRTLRPARLSEFSLVAVRWAFQSEGYFAGVAWRLEQGHALELEITTGPSQYDPPLLARSRWT